MNSRKIIIDANNEEEIRVASIINNELDEYDFEVSNKEEVKGNIYLAKVTRVESSLQAVFVEYSRDRQGFLPFNEISIDYFNIPQEEKDRLKQEYLELKAKKRKVKEAHSTAYVNNLDSSLDTPDSTREETNSTNIDPTLKKNTNLKKDYLDENINSLIQNSNSNDYFMNLTKVATKNKKEHSNKKNDISSPTEDLKHNDSINNQKNEIIENTSELNSTHSNEESTEEDHNEDKISKEYIEYGTRFGYKIQEVINRNQLLLVQVVKDERGNKGASLTTYLSIPGRYCVFMPNSTNSEGGISKKIVDNKERTRLKAILNNLDSNKDGSSLIIRTAGINKSEEEIKQDYSYILNLWDSIINKTKNSEEPSLIYEEASLIKKILRDSNFDEVYVNNKNTFYSMKEFLKLISPETIKKIKLYQGKRETIFNHFDIEEQVKSIYTPVVMLKSGGYLVIHPTEALTAIDINSGKFKGNKNVEETALKNNVEAAKEIAKQIKLRNIGGLIVIDFIDMENPKNRAIVEKKLKDEVKNDKAKIQVGQISSFGLLEMARQHVKTSLFEKNFLICQKCQGMGYLKPLELNALQILRDVKNEIFSINSNNIKTLKIKLPTQEAFFILNNKRHSLNNIEEYFEIKLIVECDDSLSYPFYEIKDITNDPNKIKKPSVLLLETEIANNLKLLKPNNTNINNRFKNKNNRNKEAFNNSRKNNNKKNIKTTIPISSTPKKGWLKRLLGI